MSFRNKLILATFAQHPFSAIALSKGVDLLNHQLTALYGDLLERHECHSPFLHKTNGLLRNGFSSNILLADETGLGKTIIIGLNLFSFILRGFAKRILIISPKSLVDQWNEEMLYKFGILFKIIDSGKMFKDLKEKIFEFGEFFGIVSLDLVKEKKGTEFLADLPLKFFDFVIFDEAHHVITKKDTMRYKVAKLLSTKTKSLIFMSATPFRGYIESEYQRLTDLLGSNFIYIRRFKDQIKDHNGNPLFPPRESYTIKIVPDIQWQMTYSTITTIINNLPIKPILRIVLKKRLASDLVSLQSTIEKIQLAKEDVFKNETDDLKNKEPDFQTKISEKSKFKNQVEMKDLKRMNIIIRNSKRKGLSLKEIEFLKIIKPMIRKHKVVVFTEYRTTLENLAKILKEEEINLVSVHGSKKFKERKFAINSFWRDEKVRVLLATDAAGEGINLQIAPYQINYDIPWSPLKLEQRFGRIHRYGQKNIARLYNLSVVGTLDDRISEKILDKIAKIASLLGDWVYDYIGEAVKASEIKDIILREDIIEERIMMQRLQFLKEDLHNPLPIEFNNILGDIDKIKTNFLRNLKTYNLNKINILEVIRSSIEIKQACLNNRNSDQGIAEICYSKASSDIIAFWCLLKKENYYLDPIEGAKISEEDMKEYLKSQVHKNINFFGFNKSLNKISFNFCSS